MTKHGKEPWVRNPNDFYPTPPKAIYYLYPHLAGVKRFCEPAAGAGDLVRALEERKLTCVLASDIEPQGEALDYAVQKDVFDICEADLAGVEVFITNPPFPSPRTHINSKHKITGPGAPTMQMIRHLIQFRPFWVLLPMDIVANKYFQNVAPYCRKMVVIGRLKFYDRKVDTESGQVRTGDASTDNFAWYYFDGKYEIGAPIQVYTGDPAKNYEHYKPADLTAICSNGAVSRNNKS